MNNKFRINCFKLELVLLIGGMSIFAEPRQHEKYIKSLFSQLVS